MRNKIISIIFGIVSFIIALIGTSLFYNWYIRPIVVIEIEEFDTPKIYTEIVKEEISKIPKISRIKIINAGKSMGNKLSLNFKTNNNTTLREVNVESRSDVLKKSSEELKDGSSIIKIDMEYIRPNEKVNITALTNIKANFFIAEKLMANGEIIEKSYYELKKSIWNAILGLLVGSIFILVLCMLNPKAVSNSIIFRVLKKI